MADIRTRTVIQKMKMKETDIIMMIKEDTRGTITKGILI
jgi:hypothetical protein